MEPLGRTATRCRQSRVCGCVAVLGLSLAVIAQTVCKGAIRGFGADGTLAAGASLGDLFPEKPTASITSIDSESGIITAKENSSGLTFTFQLTNPFLLKSLTVGQPLFVNMKNKWVSIEGSRINGNIVSVGDGAKPADSADAADDNESEASAGAAKPAAGAKSSKTVSSKQAGKTAKAGAGSQAAASGDAGAGDDAQPAGAGDNPQPPDSAAEAGAADAAKDNQPAGSVDATTPAGLADTAKQLATADAAKSLVTADMAKPIVPAGGQPAAPGEGAMPTGEGEDAQPVAPAAPAQPVAPVGGTQPVGPARGVRPAGTQLHGSPCQITNVDSGRGLITARENQTGRTFQFRLADASLLRSLNIGQALTADFASRRVSLVLNGQTVSGSIVSFAPPAAQK